jgi:hypothetical protein
MRIKQLLVAFFLFSFLLTNVTLAQIDATEIWGTISALIIQYAGLLFIVLFVFFLLLIGGVIKIPKGGISSGLVIFVVLIILAFVVPYFVPYPTDFAVPKEFQYYYLGSYAEEALGLMGLPKGWAWLPALIYFFILPFAAIYTLVWAFLKTLEIFPQTNVNRLLALIIATLTIPMSIFIKIVWVLFSFAGIWSVVIFAITFIAGIFFRGAGLVGREISLYKTYARASKTKVEQMLAQLKTARDSTPAQMREAAIQLMPEARAFGFFAVQQALATAISATDAGQVHQSINTAIAELEKQK